MLKIILGEPFFSLEKIIFTKKKRTDNAVLEIGTNERGEIKEIDVQ